MTAKNAETVETQLPASAHQIARHRMSWGLATRVSLGLIMLTGALWSATELPVNPAFSEHALAAAWYRAVDTDRNIVHAFNPGFSNPARLYPTSTGDSSKPLVVGQNVTLVTPDGTIHTLRVCDAGLSGAAAPSDCLSAFAARAVVPVVTPAPQRSL
jgi:hypothetical protein